MSLGTSQRGINGYSIFGNESLPCVEASNIQLSRSALLALLCIVRQVFWCTEQPGSSRLPKVPYFDEMLTDDSILTFFQRLSESQCLNFFTPLLFQKMFTLADLFLSEFHGGLQRFQPQAQYALWLMVQAPVSTCTWWWNEKTESSIILQVLYSRFWHWFETSPCVWNELEKFDKEPTLCDWFSRPGIPGVKKTLTKKRKAQIKALQKRRGIKVVKKHKSGWVILGTINWSWWLRHHTSKKTIMCFIYQLRSGAKDLRSTGAYPITFAKHVIRQQKQFKARAPAVNWLDIPHMMVWTLTSCYRSWMLLGRAVSASLASHSDDEGQFCCVWDYFPLENMRDQIRIKTIEMMTLGIWPGWTCRMASCQTWWLSCLAGGKDRPGTLQANLALAIAWAWVPSPSLGKISDCFL